MKKKILIVGGTGFIGSKLAKKCLSLNWKVASVSTKKPTKKKKIKNIKYIICDISKKKNLVSKIRDNYDYVVNLGGYVNHKDKIKTYNSHYLGCKNLSNFFLNKEIDSFVQMGSSLEYGANKAPHHEDMKTDYSKLKSVYARSKLLATDHLIKLNKKFNFPCTILRLYLVYGPDQEFNRFIPIIIKSCLNNEKFDCSNGKQFRDFLYISDLIDLIIKVIKNKKNIGQIVNAGSGKKYNLKKIIEKIMTISKGGLAQYGKIKLRKDEAINYYPLITKAKKIFNWSPKLKFEKGLKKTINHYKKNDKIS